MENNKKEESTNIFWDRYLTADAFSDYLDQQTDLSPQTKLQAYNEFLSIRKQLRINNHQENRGIYEIVSKWTINQIAEKHTNIEKQIAKQKLTYFIFPKLLFILGVTIGTLFMIYAKSG